MSFLVTYAGMKISTQDTRQSRCMLGVWRSLFYKSKFLHCNKAINSKSAQVHTSRKFARIERCRRARAHKSRQHQYVTHVISTLWRNLYRPTRERRCPSTLTVEGLPQGTGPCTTTVGVVRPPVGRRDRGATQALPLHCFRLPTGYHVPGFVPMIRGGWQ